MVPPGGETGTRPGLAIVGAQSPIGSAVRSALEKLGIRGDRVDLYGTSPGEALLGEYAGEARLIQAPTPEEIGRHTAVFLCEDESANDRLLGSASRRGLILDLTDSEWGRRTGRLAGTDVGDAADPGAGTGILRVPHPLSSTLAHLLRPIDRGPGLRDAVAVVLRPASDFGEPGIDELRTQTVHLLNFADVPTSVFGRQFAFNVLPQGLVGSDPVRSGDRIVRETGALLGNDSPRVSVRLVVVPVFLGHCVALRVRTGSPVAGPEEIADLLRRDPSVELTVDLATGPRTPLEVEEGAGTLVSEITRDGRDGFWLWATVADAGAAWARSAVRSAARHLKLQG